MTRRLPRERDHSGISPSEFESRKAFLEFDERDARLLARIGAELAASPAAFVNRFYEHLLKFEETRSLLADPAILERLKRAQAEYFARLLAGDYGLAYAQDRLRIGVTHHRIGLDPKWYMGAYALYLRILLPELWRIAGRDWSQALPCLEALLKVVFLDMGIAIDTYIAADKRHIVDLEEFHERIVASVPAGLLVVDAGLRAVAVNRSFVDACRCARDAIVGRPVADVLGIPEVEAPLREVLASDTPRAGLVFTARCSNSGATRPIRLAITGIRLAEEEEEEEERLLVVVEDLSTEERLAALARRSERRFHEVVENATDGIVMMGKDGLVSFFNRAAEKMFGYPRDEVLGKPATLLMPETYRGAHEKGLAGFLATGKSTMLGEVRQVEGLRKDGSIFPIESTISVYRTDGEIVFTGVLRDITQRLELEARLRQSQKMEAVGQLAGGVAHDFNNLLTVISGYTDLLLTGLSRTDPLRRNAEEVEKAAGRAASLTRQLLAFSRKQVLQPKVLDLNALVADAEKMLRRLIGEDIKLVTVLDPRLGSVKADPGQTEQVIMNLAINARDAMPGGGTLTVETANVELDQAYTRAHLGSRPGSYVMLALSDTGCGMDAETRAHIFEPFFTTKGQGKGTGLGLATVYGIVKQSGGYITFDSEPGHGTTFKIYLPRVEAPAEALQAHRPPAAPTRGTGTILLVEDEDMVRALVREILQRSGYTIVEARNGGEALLICERHAGPIHLILTDMVMPGMSGIDLVKRLAPLRPETKVLYMSGYTEHAVLQEDVLNSGAAFVQKPFAPDALAHKVREMLDSGPGRTRPAR